MSRLCNDQWVTRGGPSKSDAELVSQALAGSSDAYRQIVERFERPLISLIQRMVGERTLAEDLTQETFVKAFKNLHRFDTQRKLSSWLFKIGNNCAIDFLRRARPKTVPLEATGPDDESWEVLPAPESENPDRKAERSEAARALGAALQAMSPRYRQILLLRFQHGMAYHEIAEVTGLKMGTVKIQLHRARKKLAQRLAEAGFDAPERFVR